LCGRAVLRPGGPRGFVLLLCEAGARSSVRPGAGITDVLAHPIVNCGRPRPPYEHLFHWHFPDDLLEHISLQTPYFALQFPEALLCFLGNRDP